MPRELDGIKRKIAENKEYLKKTYGVEAIGVFGSVARGDSNEKSDVDVVVDLNYEEKPIGLLEFCGLQIFLEDLLEKKVDLITKRGIKPIIRESILRDVVYI